MKNLTRWLGLRLIDAAFLLTRVGYHLSFRDDCEREERPERGWYRNADGLPQLAAYNWERLARDRMLFDPGLKQWLKNPAYQLTRIA